ncbi:hypothetical protein GCM10023340_45120 [Nocardioides marinquilinus]|uniref:Ig-like domain-containing protein n=1 Tax=Nocardioides marinquilinus TaxID=1210400 RepID=A0ABP9Q8L0_9ACTN
MSGRLRVAALAALAGAVAAALMAPPPAGAADPVTVSFATPLPAMAQLVGDPDWTPSPTASDASTVTLAVEATPTTACTLSSTTSSGVVSFTGAGTCTVTATASASTETPKPKAERTFTITKRTQQLSWTNAAPTTQATGTTWQPSPRTTGTGQTVTLTVTGSPADACSRSDSTVDAVVSFDKAGTCTVRAEVTGGTTYDGAVLETTPAIAITRQPRTIAWGTAPPPSARNVNDAGWKPSAVATPSGEAAALAVTGDAGACTLVDQQTTPTATTADDTVTFTGVGSCTVVATVDQSPAYEGAEKRQDFTVTKRSQTVTASVPATVTTQTPYAVSVTSGTGNTPTLSILAAHTANCSLNAGKVTYVKVNQPCTVNVSVPGNAEYDAGATTVDRTPSKGTPIITVTPPTGTQRVGVAWTPVEVTTTGTLVPTLASSTTGVCTASGRTVTFVGTGPCSITATTVGQTSADENTTTSAAVTFTVAKQDQSIAVVAPGTRQARRVYAPVVDTATSTGNTGAFATPSYSAPGQSAVCTPVDATGAAVTSSTVGVRLLKAGQKCTITVTVTGNGTYNAGTAQVEVTPVKLTPLMSVAGPGRTLTALGTDWAVDVNVDNATGVTLTSADNTVCQPRTGTFNVQLKKSGTCTITATAPVTDDQETATATPAATVTVQKTTQTINVVAAGATRQVRRTYKPAVNTSTSTGNTDAFATPTFRVVPADSTACTPVDASGAPVASSTIGVRPLKAGQACTVSVTVAGNDVYEDGVGTVTFIPIKLTPVLAVAAPTEPLVALGDDWSVQVTLDSAEGVTLSSSDNTVCQPRAGTFDVQLKKGGTCTITASAPVTTDQSAGTASSGAQTVTKATQTVSVTFPSQPQALDVLTPTVVSSTGNTATFDSLTTSVCTAADSTTVTAKTAGTCKLRVTVPTSAVYKQYVSTTATDPSVELALRTPRLAFVPDPTAPRRLGQVSVKAIAYGKDDAPLAGTGWVRVSDLTPPDPVTPDVTTWPVTGFVRGPFSAPKRADITASARFQPSLSMVYDTVTGSSTITLGKAAQTMTFTTPDPDDELRVGQTWHDAVHVTPSGELATVTSLTPLSCTPSQHTVDGVTHVDVRFNSTGDCRLSATAAGDDDHDPVAATASPTYRAALRAVDLVDVTITPTPTSTGPTPLRPYHLETITVSARAVDHLSGATVTRGTGTASVTPAPPGGVTTTTTSGVVTATFRGTAGVSYGVDLDFAPADPADPNDPANPSVYAAPETLERTIAVNKAPQSLAFSPDADHPVPAVAYPDETYTPQITPGESTGARTVATADTTVCTAASGVITFKNAGAADNADDTCTIRLSQDGDTHYLPAGPLEQPVTVRRRPVTLDLSFSSRTPAFGDQITVTVTATDTRRSAPVLGNGTGTLTVPGLAGSPFTLNYVNGVATLRTPKLPTSDGLVFTANFTHNRSRAFTKATDTDTLLVKAAQQVITPDPALVRDVYLDEPTTLTVTAGGSDQAVTATVQALPADGDGVVPPPACAVSSTGALTFQVTFSRVDPCVVLLNQAGQSPDFDPATEVPVAFTIHKRPVALRVSTSATPTYGEPVVVTVTAVDKRLAAAGTTSVVGGTLAFGLDGTDATSSPGVTGTALATYTPPSSGRQQLTATLSPAQGARYELLTADRTAGFDVVRAGQVTTFTPTAGQLSPYVADSVTFAPAGTGQGAVRLVLDTRAGDPPSGTFPVPDDQQPGTTPPAPGAQVGEFCTVTGLTVTFTKAGPCHLAAYQTGVLTRFLPSSPVFVTATASRIPLDVSFERTPTQGLVVGAPVDLKTVVRDVKRSGSFSGSGTTGLLHYSDPALGGDGTWKQEAVSARSDTWLGNIRTFRAFPEHAGRYRLVEHFTPSTTSAPRYEVQRGAAPLTDPTPSLEFTVGKGSQRLVPVTPTDATARYVGITWTPVLTTSGGSSAEVVPTVTQDDAGDLPQTVDLDDIDRQDPPPGVYCVPDGDDGIVLVQAGPCRVRFDQAGDDDYEPAPPVMVRFAVVTAPTTVTLARVGSTPAVVGENVTLRATSVGPAPDRLPLRGEFRFTGVPGQTGVVSVPSTSTGTAEIGFKPRQQGARSVSVTFVPANGVNFGTSPSTSLTVTANAGQLAFTSQRPTGDVVGYAGSTWDPQAEVTAGPDHDPLPVVSEVPPTTPVTDDPCYFDSGDGLVHFNDWPATGPEADAVTRTCRVQLRVEPLYSDDPARPDWKGSTAVAFSIPVRRSPTAITLPSVPTNATITTETTLTAEVTGLTFGTTATVPVGSVVFSLGRQSSTGTPTDPRTEPCKDGPPPTTMTDTMLATEERPGGVTVGVASVVFPKCLDWGNYRVTATFKPGDTQRGQWAPSTTSLLGAGPRTADFLVDRLQHTIVRPVPDPFDHTTVGGQRDLSGVVTTAGLPVDMETSGACTNEGRVVRFEATGPCVVTLDQDGNRYYKKVAQPELYNLVVGLNDSTTTLQVGANPVAGQPLPLTATVSAPRPTPTAPDAADGTGTVDFTVDGVVVQRGVPVRDGRATSSWTPDLPAQEVEIAAEFVPDATSALAYEGSESDPQTVVVAKAPSGISLAITTRGGEARNLAITATVEKTGVQDPSGSVELVLTGDTAPDVSTVVPLGTDLKAVWNLVRPTDDEFTVTAKYLGDQRYSSRSTSLDRPLPRLSFVLRPGAVDGWIAKPVDVDFSCSGPSGVKITCPRDVTLGDGDHSREADRTFTATGANGGQDTVVIPVIRIDRVRPTLAVPNVKQGGVYFDKTPVPYCTADDALSGLARPCRAPVTKVDRTTRRVSAVAVDRAGNETTVVKTYRELQEWVQGARLDARNRFVVKPGSRIQVRAVSTGETPRVRFGGPNGSWKDGPAMVATSVRNGVYTWYAYVNVPKKLAGFRIGVRVGAGQTFGIPVVGR